MADILMPEGHPAFPVIREYASRHGLRVLTTEPDGGDVLFIISWSFKVWPHLYDRAYVIHESALPQGRGWSPLVHQILEGKNQISYTMIRVDEGIDTGPIVMQKTLVLEGNELAPEIHQKSASLKCSMMQEALHGRLEERPQVGEPTYYPRRTPKDSALDPDKSIREQFNLLRVCDDRFPAFFDLDGHLYEIKLRRL